MSPKPRSHVRILNNRIWAITKLLTEALIEFSASDWPGDIFWLIRIIISKCLSAKRLSATLACVASDSSRVIARKLEREQKKEKRKGEGEGRGVSFAPFPLPPHSFFFLLSSQPSRRTRAETLAMQASAILKCEKLSHLLSTSNA